MPITPWRPFGDRDRSFDDEDWLMPVASRLQRFGPAIDIYETDKELVAEINLPGADPDKIDVSVKDQVLRVSGIIEEKKEEKKKGYWRREVHKGSFERSVRLPVPVKEGRIDATYEKGVLKIVMPKASVKPPEKEKKIKVKAKD